MGKVTECYISLAERGQCPVYHPGETVYGRVILKVTGAISVNAVKVTCLGASLTKWKPLLSREFSDDCKSKEVYLHRFFNVLGGKGTTVNLTEGTHVYAFRFELPLNIPSSFEGKNGAIRYTIHVRVDKKFPGINYDRYRGFTVLTDLEIDLKTMGKPLSKECSKTISKTLGIGDAGEVKLSASIDKTGFCPGETILINLTAVNKSSKDCGKVVAKLVQHVYYSNGNDDRNTYTDTGVLTSNIPLKKGETMSWNQTAMTIPAVPPSSVPLTCHIIKIDYRVEVKVEVPWQFDLKVLLPLTIGTVPAGVTKKKELTKNKAGGIHVKFVYSKPLTYVPCTIGVEFCDKNDDNVPFPNFNYTPLTLFYGPVVNEGASSKLTTSADPRQNHPTDGTTTTTTVGKEATETASKLDTTETELADRAGNINLATDLSETSIESIESMADEEQKVEQEASVSSNTTHGIVSNSSSSVSVGYKSSSEEKQTLSAVLNLPPPSIVGAGPTNETTFDEEMISGVFTDQPPPRTTGSLIGHQQEDLPPDYESIFPPPSQIEPINGPDSDNEWKGVALCLIFPVSQIQLMMECLKSRESTIRSHSGTVLDAFEKFEILPPRPLSAISVIFPQETQALSWYRQFKCSSPTPDLLVMLCVSNTPQIPLMDTTLFPFFVMKSIRVKCSLQEMLCYVRQFNAIVVPLSDKYGGKKIISSSKVKFIDGDWSDMEIPAKKMIFVMSQWPSGEHFQAFGKELEKLPDYDQIKGQSESKREMILKATSGRNNYCDYVL